MRMGPPDFPRTSPERIGKYELLVPLGAGGTGTVYLARARGPRGFERDVAVKVVHEHLRHAPEWQHELIFEAPRLLPHPSPERRLGGRPR
jgi:serine/threonine-protein kinase